MTQSIMEQTLAIGSKFDNREHFQEMCMRLCTAQHRSIHICMSSAARVDIVCSSRVRCIDNKDGELSQNASGFKGCCAFQGSAKRDVLHFVAPPSCSTGTGAGDGDGATGTVQVQIQVPVQVHVPVQVLVLVLVLVSVLVPVLVQVT